MSRAVAVPVIVRVKVGMLGVGAVCRRAWGRVSVMAALLTLSLVLAGEAAPGDLDPTFGVGGKVITDLGSFGDQAIALVLQPDGKLVAAGVGEAGSACCTDFVLARYLPDGGLDPTFGTGGMVATDFGSYEGAIALVLQPDGKLVAGGMYRAVRGV